MPATMGSWEGQDVSSSRAFRESMTLPTPSFQTFSLQNHERVYSRCSETAGLWSFVPAAPGS